MSMYNDVRLFSMIIAQKFILNNKYFKILSSNLYNN